MVEAHEVFLIVSYTPSRYADIEYNTPREAHSFMHSSIADVLCHAWCYLCCAGAGGYSYCGYVLDAMCYNSLLFIPCIVRIISAVSTLNSPDVLCCFVQVRVASKIAHVLSLPRRQLDGFLGAVGSGLASRGQVLAALRQCRSLQVRYVTVFTHL
jgi:hypothetical protein